MDIRACNIAPFESLAQGATRLIAEGNEFPREFHASENIRKVLVRDSRAFSMISNARVSRGLSSFDLNVSQSPVHNYILTSGFVSAMQRAVSAG